MAKIINLSEAASLGIHAMVLIAQHKTYVKVNDLADQFGASRNHLAKVLQRVAKVGYLRSVSGPGGGFMLSKPANQISILDIYEAIEGRIDLPECPLDRPLCPFNMCLMSNLLSDVTTSVREYFKNSTLEKFANSDYKKEAVSSF